MDKNVTAEAFSDWQETRDIMSNPAEVAAIEKAMCEKDRGEVVTLEEFTKSFCV